MAINYINESFVTRRKGHNAVRGSAYRSNQKFHCDRTGKTFDYTKKTDCVYKEVMLPLSAFTGGVSKKSHPLYNREKLWNKVEEIESQHNRHATAQLSIELRIALPKELTRDRQIDLLKSFISENYVNKYSVAADIIIQDKGDGNPNASVNFSLRKIIGSDLSKRKIRDLASSQIKKGQYGVFRKNSYLHQKWADYQNEYFKKHGIDLCVDQGHLIPTIHEGRFDNKSENHKKKYNVESKLRNFELVKKNPSIILDVLHSRNKEFTDYDLKNIVHKVTQCEDDFIYIYNRLVTHKNLVTLRKDDDGRHVFTLENKS